jgi:hypothetical protein
MTCPRRSRAIVTVSPCGPCSPSGRAHATRADVRLMGKVFPLLFHHAWASLRARGLLPELRRTDVPSTAEVRKEGISRIAGHGRPGPYGRFSARARGAFQLRCAEHRGRSPGADCRRDHTHPCARGFRAIRDCLTAPTRAGPVTRPHRTPGPAPPSIEGSLSR